VGAGAETPVGGTAAGSGNRRAVVGADRERGSPFRAADATTIGNGSFRHSLQSPDRVG